MVRGRGDYPGSSTRVIVLTVRERCLLISPIRREDGKLEK